MPVFRSFYENIPSRMLTKRLIVLNLSRRNYVRGRVQKLDTIWPKIKPSCVIVDLTLCKLCVNIFL